MGARVYNPVVGRFTSCDPVPGGNENAYNYPNDPVNSNDVTGQAALRTLLSIGIAVAAVAAGIACGVSVICGIAVGAAAGALAYTATNAGTKSFSGRGLALATGLGALGGALGGGIARSAGIGKLSSVVKQSRSLGSRTVRVHYDLKPHPFKIIGPKSHWQVEVYKKGVKGSGKSTRIPSFKTFR